MKSVILFVPTLAVAGAEILVSELAARTRGRGWGVVIATTSERTPGRLLAYALETGVEVIDVSASSRLVTTVKILRLLRRIRPDAVHTHLSSLLLVMGPAWLTGVPSRVHTFHSLAWRNGRRALYRLAFRVFGFTPVSIAKSVAQSVEDFVRLKPSQVLVIENGVDLDRFSTRSSERDTGRIIFIAVGRLYPVKNHELLIDSFMQARIPDAELWIAGDGPQRECLELHLATQCAQSKVSLLGSVSGVADILREASVFVSSSDVEGMPISMLEAMASGLPVVATKAGGVVDLVQDGVNGLLVEVGDTVGLAEAMRLLANDEDQRRSMGRESRRLARRYSIELTTDKYIELYATVGKVGVL